MCNEKSEIYLQPKPNKISCKHNWKNKSLIGFEPVRSKRTFKHWSALLYIYLLLLAYTNSHFRSNFHY